MKNDDIELIQRILADDESAFAELVNKYQKQVHALAWRKLGDFHIAEEITQDTFLKVYQRLHTLNDLNLFSGWLYVITANLCASWRRKKRLQTQPLEDIENTMSETDVYSEHVAEERIKTDAETQREVVKKLLEKLKESERTVMTLHYLGEMTVEEISKFIGVSTGTIKSRLQRARNRLQKEETMIREALEHFQLSPNLTDNIMQEVAQLKPTPSSSKPFIPWTVVASTAVLIALMLGIGNQHLARFQIPYSLDAQSEMSVELVEAPIVQDMVVESEVQNQIGSANAVGKSDTPRPNPDEVLLAAAETEGTDKGSVSKQWIAGNVPGISDDVHTVLATTDRGIYLLDYNENLYKSAFDGTEWEQVSNLRTLLSGDRWVDKIPLADFNDTLYIVILNEIFASTDGGETWNSVGECPKGDFVDLVVIDETFYLAAEHGVFISKDSGKTWEAINNGLKEAVISLDLIQDTLFLRTDTGIYSTGLYRFVVDRWEPVDFPVADITHIRSFAGTDDILYIMAVSNVGDFSKNNNISQYWVLYRSTDKGNSWTEITPKNAHSIFGNQLSFENEPLASLVVKKNTVLIIGWDTGSVIRSSDTGNTWTHVTSTGISVIPGSVHDAVGINDSTFYIYGQSGIYRTFDGGKSWSRYNTQPKSGLYNLTFVSRGKEKSTSESLYAMTREEVFKSTDKGKSWYVVNPEKGLKIGIPTSSRIVESGGRLYAKCQSTFRPEIVTLYRLSDTRKTLIPIQGMPVFDSRNLYELLQAEEVIQPHEGILALTKMFVRGSDMAHIERLQKSSVGATQFFRQLAIPHPFQSTLLRRRGLQGVFAVSDDIFYMEYNFKLFRWESGDTEWYDTGQEETVVLTRDRLKKDLKLAALGNTVYVGKRDGKLMASFDKGTNWIDFTSTLPFPVIAFNEIVFAGTTVYVATDAGVATSGNGKNWRALVDVDGTILVMEHLAVDGNTLYGVKEKSGIYRLKNGIWEQVVSEIPDSINSLAVDGKTLYVGTQNQGMLHYTLE